jgi:hypothetical protein
MKQRIVSSCPGLAAGRSASRWIRIPWPAGSRAGGRVAARAALAGLLVWAAARPAAALPLLSEVFYDAVGSDDGLGFVEIYGTPGTPLDGLSVEVVNGSDGGVVATLPLSGTIPDDGLFVVADQFSDGTTAVPGADLLLNFDIQNGPDSVVLRDGAGVLDALGFGDFGPGEVFAGEGAPAPDVPAGSSLARRFANVDSDDNAGDFVELAVPTPGTADLAPVPEPASALLAATGCAALGAFGHARARAERRRRRRAPQV